MNGPLRESRGIQKDKSFKRNKGVVPLRGTCSWVSSCHHGYGLLWSPCGGLSSDDRDAALSLQSCVAGGRGCILSPRLRTPTEPLRWPKFGRPRCGLVAPGLRCRRTGLHQKRVSATPVQTNRPHILPDLSQNRICKRAWMVLT